MSELTWKVVYISGPMTGLPELNYPAFFAAADILESRGFIVLNPANNPLGLSDDAYMDIDLAMVRHSDAIAVLPGWQESLGAQAEVALAKRLGISVMRIEDIQRLFTEKVEG